MPFELYPEGVGDATPVTRLGFGPFEGAVLSSDKSAYLRTERAEFDVSWRRPMSKFSMGIGTSTSAVKGHFGVGPIRVHGKLRVLPKWLPQAFRRKTLAEAYYMEGSLVADGLVEENAVRRFRFNWRDAVLGEHRSERELISRFRLPVSSEARGDFELEVEVERIHMSRQKLDIEECPGYNVSVSGGGFEISYGFGNKLPCRSGISSRFVESFVGDTGESPLLEWDKAKQVGPDGTGC